MLDIDDVSDDNVSTQSPRVYSSEVPDPIVLKEWLTTDEPLHFHFDARLYQDLIEYENKHYTEFANENFKLLQQLEDADLRFEDTEYEIGVIDNSKLAKLAVIEDKINFTFLKIIENLETLINKSNSDNEETMDDSQANYELLLHILDCLYAHKFILNANLKPNYLCKWVNRFDPQPDRQLVQDVMMIPKPYLHPLFWNRLISKLICRGLMDQAVNAIKNSHYEELQENTESSVVYEVIEDLTNLLISYNTMSLKNQFANWKLSCCEFRDLFHTFKKKTSGSNLRLLDQIHDLLLILTGLPKTISNYSDSWYEIFACLSLYQVRDEEPLYKEYFEISTNEKPPSLITVDPYKNLEKTFLNIFEGNYLHVLMQIDEIDSSTSSLVSRLLEIKKILSSYYSTVLTTGLRSISEYLLTKYAYQCLENHSLVPIGIGILLNDHVMTDPKTNKAIIAEFLPNYHCKTNDDLEWSLTICAKLGLVTTANELYKIHGSKSLKEGYIYEALNMLVNGYSADEPLDETTTQNEAIKGIHHIVWDIIFQDSLLNGRPVEDELINNIIEHKVKFDIHPVIKQCLSPYGVLYEFFKANKQILSESILAKDKISKLIHLLEFIHLPKKFVPLLLGQFFVFLSDEHYLFQIPDLIVIIELIDNFEDNLVNGVLDTCQELYEYAISMEIDDDSDWRKILKKQSKIPENVQSLIRLLRNKIAHKIGQVYVT